MPTAGDLPESLVELSFRQAIEIDSGRDFHPHTDRLIRSMDQLLSRNASVLTTKKAVDLAAVGAGLTAGPAVRKLTSLFSSKFRRIIILTGVLVLTIFATLALLNQMDGGIKTDEAPATSAASSFAHPVQWPAPVH
jgi:hypothetical protein